MINQLDYNLAEAAELYALSGIASADAFIACWKCKYQVNLLRPKTYIRENMDPNWSSFIGTPPFPEYTSGHSVCSGAVSEVMTQYIGNQSFTDDVNTPINGIAPRTLSSFYEAADEAAMSRLYGGIHFREAIENGISQGRCLGQTLMNSIKLDK
jgi:hypothetical protein